MIGLWIVIMVGLTVAWLSGYWHGVGVGHGAAKEGVAMEAVNETAERLVAYTRAIEKGCPRCGHRLIAGELTRSPGALAELLAEQKARTQSKKRRRS